METIKIDLDQGTIEALAVIKIQEILKDYLSKIEYNIQSEDPSENKVSLEEYYKNLEEYCEMLGVGGDGDLSLEPYGLRNYTRDWE